MTVSLFRKSLRLGAATFVLIAGGATFAPAQFFNRPTPPANVQEEDEDNAPGGAAQEAQSVLLQRVERLEKDLKSLTGQIEQLQHQVRRLEENARSPAANPAPAPGPSAAPAFPSRGTIDAARPPGAIVSSPIAPPAAPATPNPPASPPSDTAKLRRGDAFDPSQNPSAPGAPRQIGATAPSAPLAPPLETTRAAQTPAPETPAPIGAAGLENGVAPPNGPRDEFNAATGLLKQGNYDGAEKGFSAFLSKYPKSRLAADAHYQLGESYFQRNRPTEAAQQFLKITTDFPAAARAPEALLRLGQSLSALGAKEQACASFAEIGRKYPNASANLRASADREAKKAAC